MRNSADIFSRPSCILSLSMYAHIWLKRDGSITIKALREVANALDMQLVYGFVPKDGSLDALVDRKARELAKQIVLRTSNTMKLEDQENSQERIGKAIEERATAIRSEMPKALWD